MAFKAALEFLSRASYIRLMPKPKDRLKMIPHDRASYLARIDGLSSELQRLGLYSKQHLNLREAETFRSAIRMLSQWCARMNNDQERD